MQDLLRSLVGLIALLVFVPPRLLAQRGDTLRGASVTGSRSAAASVEDRMKIYAPGLKSIRIDSATLERYRQQSVAALLAQQTPVFVKSYGFNNLSTLQFRGASAAQSLVVWNGIPLQNAASGLTDVSTLPVLLADDISLQYGSSTALLGSGNVGGALLLNSRPAPDSFLRQATVFAGAGSFSQYQTGLRLRANGGRWKSQGRLFYQQGQNDFSYLANDGTRRRLPNAALCGWNAALDVGYRMNAVNTLSIHGWLHAYQRQIPPALFERSSVQHIEDGALRLAFNWQHQGKQSWYVRAAWLQDRLQFEDSSIRISSDARVKTLYAEAGWEKAFGKRHRILVFAPVQHSAIGVKTTSFSQERLALALALRSRLLAEGQLLLAGALRAESVNGSPYLIPGLNAAYRLGQRWTLQGNVQRTYRVPTLNELYYQPGGNPDLVAESGWNADGGYRFDLELPGRLSLRHQLHAYNRVIDNWIAWFGGAIWTPHNIAQVYSRGLEADLELSVPLRRIRLRAGAHGAWNRSTTERSRVPGDNSIGRQVPYAPRWMGQGSLAVEYRGLSLVYLHSYTGIRYVTTDESLALPGYQLGTVQIAWNAAMGRLRLDFQCNNIFGARYQVVAGRPMPGRFFSAGASATFVKGRPENKKR